MKKILSYVQLVALAETNPEERVCIEKNGEVIEMSATDALSEIDKMFFIKKEEHKEEELKKRPGQWVYEIVEDLNCNVSMGDELFSLSGFSLNKSQRQEIMESIIGINSTDALSGIFKMEEIFVQKLIEFGLDEKKAKQAAKETINSFKF
ncbi:MAG: hypothetical protein WC414_01905 [Patescibacteria group bacterium]